MRIPFLPKKPNSHTIQSFLQDGSILIDPDGVRGKDTIISEKYHWAWERKRDAEIYVHRINGRRPDKSGGLAVMRVTPKPISMDSNFLQHTLAAVWNESYAGKPPPRGVKSKLSDMRFVSIGIACAYLIFAGACYQYNKQQAREARLEEQRIQQETERDNPVSPTSVPRRTIVPLN